MKTTLAILLTALLIAGCATTGPLLDNISDLIQTASDWIDDPGRIDTASEIIGLLVDLGFLDEEFRADADRIIAALRLLLAFLGELGDEAAIDRSNGRLEIIGPDFEGARRRVLERAGLQAAIRGAQRSGR